MLFTLFPPCVQLGETPLWIASVKGHQKCVDLLINAGANDIPSEVSVSRCTNISDLLVPYRHLSYSCVCRNHAARIEHISSWYTSI